jgi:hypothetical protein
MAIIKQHQQIGTVRRFHDAEFLICKSCFWCASILSFNTYYLRCPACKNMKLESTPLSEGEAYSINTENENLSIEFWNLTN